MAGVIGVVGYVGLAAGGGGRGAAGRGGGAAKSDAHGGVVGWSLLGAVVFMRAGG